MKRAVIRTLGFILSVCGIGLNRDADAATGLVGGTIYKYTTMSTHYGHFGFHDGDTITGCATTVPSEINATDGLCVTGGFYTETTGLFSGMGCSLENYSAPCHYVTGATWVVGDVSFSGCSGGYYLIDVADYPNTELASVCKDGGTTTHNLDVLKACCQPCPMGSPAVYGVDGISSTAAAQVLSGVASINGWHNETDGGVGIDSCYIWYSGSSVFVSGGDTFGLTTGCAYTK